MVEEPVPVEIAGVDVEMQKEPIPYSNLSIAQTILETVTPFSLNTNEKYTMPTSLNDIIESFGVWLRGPQGGANLRQNTRYLDG